MSDRGPSKLVIDCEICGEPMLVGRQRYVELIRAGRKPRCRKNGCERLLGRQSPGTARTTGVLDVTEVPPHLVSWPSYKRGNSNGALAKLRVRSENDWRYEAAVEEGKDEDV